MGLFMIRVELHNASSQDYAQLAKNLANIGIVDIITSHDGRTFRLPPAEYCYEGQSTLQGIYNSTHTVASQMVSRFAVVVTEVGGDGCLWDGLQLVHQ